MTTPSPTALQFVERAKSLSTKFATTAAEYDHSGDFAFANIEALNEAGLLTLPIRSAAGGPGLGLGVAQTVVGWIAQGDASTALVLTMHYMQHAAIAQRDNWPESLALKLEQESLGGISLVNALLAEPDVGSITRGGVPGTVAHKVDGGWRLTGWKAYATGIPALSWLVVLARFEDGEQPRVGAVLIPRSAPGIQVKPTWDHAGMRATHSHDVYLDGVFVPDDHVLSQRSSQTPTGSAPDRGSVTMLWYTGLAGAIYDGIARAARDWLVQFLNTRVPTNLGAPLASVARLQEAVGGIEILLGTNAVLLRDFAAQVDAGGDPAALAAAGALLKHVIVDNAVEVTSRALDLAGNRGLSRRSPLERFLRDALCGRIQAPQNDLLRVAAGNAALARAAAAAKASPVTP